MKKYIIIFLILSILVFGYNNNFAVEVKIYDNQNDKEQVNIYDEVDIYNEVDIYSENEVDIYAVGLTSNSGDDSNIDRYINIDIPPISGLVYIIPIIFIIMATAIITLSNSENKSKNNKMFYPPNNSKATQIAYLLKGKIENKDVISILFDLINSGYVKISEKRDKVNFFKAHEFEIVKIKDYDGKDMNERIFFEGMFKRDASVLSAGSDNFTSSVMSYQLRNFFYKKLFLISGNIDEANKSIKKSKNEEKFNFTCIPKYIALVLILLISFCIALAFPVIDYINIRNFIPIIILGSVAVVYLFSIILSLASKNKVNLKIILISVILALIVGGLFLSNYFNVLDLYISNLIIYLIGYFVCLISCTCILKCITKVERKTKIESNDIEDFKNTLQNITVDEIKKIMQNDKYYFYHMFSYVYIFDILDVWVDKFMSIDVPEYSGYLYDGISNIQTFKEIIIPAIDEIKKDMLYIPEL